MRLGLLGPADGDLAALERGARLLVEREQADRTVYLGADDALDLVVAGWARGLVGGDPSDGALWVRAAGRCGGATPEEIDAFLATERARLALRRLECLPLASARTVEIVDGRVAVLLHDRGLLDEEDILPATLLVYGRHPEPLIKRVGARTFLSPGPASLGAAMLVDDAADGVRFLVFDAAGATVRSEIVAPPHGARRERATGG